MQPELAITKFRKDVVHLEEDGFEESDKEEENEKPVKTGLAEQLVEETQGIGGALPDSLSDATPERGTCATRFGAY